LKIDQHHRRQNIIKYSTWPQSQSPKVSGSD